MPGTLLDRRGSLSGPRAGAAITGALVAGAAAVWGALEVAALIALDGATTVGAAYVLIRVRRWRRRARRGGDPAPAAPAAPARSG